MISVLYALHPEWKEKMILCIFSSMLESERISFSSSLDFQIKIFSNNSFSFLVNFSSVQILGIRKRFLDFILIIKIGNLVNFEVITLKLSFQNLSRNKLFKEWEFSINLSDSSIISSSHSSSKLCPSKIYHYIGDTPFDEFNNPIENSTARDICSFFRWKDRMFRFINEGFHLGDIVIKKVDKLAKLTEGLYNSILYEKLDLNLDVNNYYLVRLVSHFDSSPVQGQEG
ncbi:hypothetical protein C1645_836163 [Glomus cerebriforme]|uniref:Uncharacterized protein n=1 Tax=Glomus cerebriforme TaxID=658196 RepID=A0A397SCB1_9GLOM|nr:hypothetical protein C1645_836163 [Glomus cerebriforme]